MDVHPDHKPIQNLTLRFSFQYEKLASVANLEQAVTLRRAALNLCPPGHSNALRLSDLGLDLRHRFLKLGATIDLDEALSLHRSALDLE